MCARLAGMISEELSAAVHGSLSTTLFTCSNVQEQIIQPTQNTNPQNPICPCWFGGGSMPILTWGESMPNLVWVGSLLILIRGGSVSIFDWWGGPCMVNLGRSMPILIWGGSILTPIWGRTTHSLSWVGSMPSLIWVGSMSSLACSRYTHTGRAFTAGRAGLSQKLLYPGCWSCPPPSHTVMPAAYGGPAAWWLCLFEIQHFKACRINSVYWRIIWD